MCLVKLRLHDASEVSAFKIFGQDEQGRLTSAFVPAKKEGQFYPPNQKISVDDPNIGFFAFEELSTAAQIALEGTRKWCLVPGNLLILPVTLYGTIFKGIFRPIDPQCSDGAYPAAFTGTQIVVHDSEENRRLCYTEMVKQDLRNRYYEMSPSLKSAYQNLLGFPVEARKA